MHDFDLVETMWRQLIASACTQSRHGISLECMQIVLMIMSFVRGHNVSQQRQLQLQSNSRLLDLQRFNKNENTNLQLQVTSIPRGHATGGAVVWT